MKSSSLPISTSTLRDELAVDRARRLEAAERLPQARPVVEVVRDDRAGRARRVDRLGDDRRASSRRARRRCRRCGTSARPRRRRARPSRRRPARSAAAAVWPRSETPTAPRTPKPRSVKLSPLRSARPMPSNGRHSTWLVSTPPWSMQSSTSRPTSLSASAVTIAVRRPKQRRRPRATLYSPPPSQTLEAARVADPPLARVEPQHHLAERDEVVARIGHAASAQADRLGGQPRDARPSPVRRGAWARPSSCRRSRAPAAAGGTRPRCALPTPRSGRSEPRGTAPASAAMSAAPPRGSAGKSLTASRPSASARASSVAVAMPGSTGTPARGSARRPRSSSAGQTTNCAPAASASSSCVDGQDRAGTDDELRAGELRDDRVGRGLGAERHLDRRRAAGGERCRQRHARSRRRRRSRPGARRARRGALERVGHRPSQPPSTGARCRSRSPTPATRGTPSRRRGRRGSPQRPAGMRSRIARASRRRRRAAPACCRSRCSRARSR